MSAQRKLADPALSTPPVETPEIDYQSPSVTAGEHPVSPAILLQEELAARIAHADTAPIPGTADVAEVKLPMGLRIATIVTLSLLLWGGIFLTAAKLIT